MAKPVDAATPIRRTRNIAPRRSQTSPLEPPTTAYRVLGGSQRPSPAQKHAQHGDRAAGPASGAKLDARDSPTSQFPNRQGHDQVRRVTVEGGRLSIIASDRTSADGRTFHGELIWLTV